MGPKLRTPKMYTVHIICHLQNGVLTRLSAQNKPHAKTQREGLETPLPRGILALQRLESQSCW